MGVVKIKWTDPPDILTNEPAPAIWAGTVVVRKSGSAPLHKWDGTIIVDSTTRDEYSVNPLIDNNIEPNATYYYGIFPYDTKGDYRYTKVVKAFAAEIPAPEINNLELTGTSVNVNYTIPAGYAWDYITLVYKKNSAPASKTDGTAVSLSAAASSVTVSGLDINSRYYFKIFAMIDGASEELQSNIESVSTLAESYRCLEKITVDGVEMPLLQINDFTQIPSETKNRTTFGGNSVYALNANAPDFVTDNGTDFFKETSLTWGSSKRAVINSQYFEVDCPSGTYNFDGETISGLRIFNNVTSAYISNWGTELSNLPYGDSYRSHYIGVVLEETYERGYLLIMVKSNHLGNNNNGYQVYAYGGIINGVDYVYETFKNM